MVKTAFTLPFALQTPGLSRFQLLLVREPEPLSRFKLPIVEAILAAFRPFRASNSLGSGLSRFQLPAVCTFRASNSRFGPLWGGREVGGSPRSDGLSRFQLPSSERSGMGRAATGFRASNSRIGNASAEGTEGGGRRCGLSRFQLPVWAAPAERAPGGSFAFALPTPGRGRRGDRLYKRG